MQRILLTYLFITLGVSTYAQQLSTQDEQFADSLMNANYKPDKPGAVLLIAKNGLPVFRKGYGLANLEFKVNNKPEYIFRIGSMSKQFIAVCILKLAQEGKLNLHYDITKYLTAYNTHGRHITIEHLLTHTSGIIDFFDKKEFAAKAMNDQTKEETMNFFMNDSLLFEPGTDYSYSNSGYTLAGFIIEKVSGMALNDYVQQNIFNPLEMLHTSLGNQDSSLVNAVNDYEHTGNDRFKPAGQGSWSWIYVAGGIRTNVDDLLKWDNALYTEKIIKKEWLEKAWKPFELRNGQTTYYGFGWCNSSFRGMQFITHSGMVGGFISNGIRIPSKQIYIVILSNIYPPWVPEISTSIALHLTGHALTLPRSTSMDKKKLNNYVGVYALKRPGSSIPVDSIHVQDYQYFVIKNDTLCTEYMPDGAKQPLLNVSKDVFAPSYGGQYYQFNRNKKGNITSVELYSEPVQYGPRLLKIKTGRPVPKEKQAITLDLKKLELLKGKYDFDGGNIAIVTVAGNKLFIRMPGQETEEIFAENETNFFSKSTGFTFKFKKDEDRVSGLVVNLGGKLWESKKAE